jgi:hypothetical protein
MKKPAKFWRTVCHHGLVRSEGNARSRHHRASAFISSRRKLGTHAPPILDGKEKGGRCPLWVISGHLRCKRPCPFYPRKRTFAAQNATSALGQKQTVCLFDNLISKGKQRRRNPYPYRFGGFKVDRQFVLGRQQHG